MQYEKEVNSGLKKASKESRREGKWANPPEVRNESVVPRVVNVRIVLDQLVKESRAEKKKGELLYRPTGGGVGGIGFGNSDKEGYRSPDPYDSPRSSPKDNDSVETWKGDEPITKPDAKPGDAVQAAVGIMLAGGMSGSGGSSIPKVGGMGITHL